MVDDRVRVVLRRRIDLHAGEDVRHRIHRILLVFQRFLEDESILSNRRYECIENLSAATIYMGAGLLLERHVKRNHRVKLRPEFPACLTPRRSPSPSVGLMGSEK